MKVALSYLLSIAFPRVLWKSFIPNSHLKWIIPSFFLFSCKTCTKSGEVIFTAVYSILSFALVRSLMIFRCVKASKTLLAIKPSPIYFFFLRGHAGVHQQAVKTSLVWGNFHTEVEGFLAPHEENDYYFSTETTRVLCVLGPTHWARCENSQLKTYFSVFVLDLLWVHI